MYKMIGTPRVINYDDQRHITIYKATMAGDGNEILAVANQRQQDQSCVQIPHAALWSKHHLVKVVYALGEGYFISIQVVKSSFDDGAHWSIFYDPKNGREGSVHPLPQSCKITYYFLTSEQCEEILACLYGFQDKTARRKLARHPDPDNFLEEETTEEDLPAPVIKQKF